MLTYYIVAVITLMTVHAKNCTYEEAPADCCNSMTLRPEIGTYAKHCDTKTNDECEFMTCIAKKMSVMTADGKWDLEKTKDFIIKGKTPVWNPIIDKVLKICTMHMKGAECVPELFFECVPYTLYKNCPSSDWTKSPECSKLKIQMEDCEFNDFLRQ